MDKAVQDLKDITGERDVSNDAIAKMDTESVLKTVRSMEEITTQIPEYEYQRDKSVVVCIVCGETFKYKNNLDNDQRIFQSKK